MEFYFSKCKQISKLEYVPVTVVRTTPSRLSSFARYSSDRKNSNQNQSTINYIKLNPGPIGTDQYPKGPAPYRDNISRIWVWFFFVLLSRVPKKSTEYYWKNLAEKAAELLPYASPGRRFCASNSQHPYYTQIKQHYLTLISSTLSAFYLNIVITLRCSSLYHKIHFFFSFRHRSTTAIWTVNGPSPFFGELTHYFHFYAFL